MPTNKEEERERNVRDGEDNYQERRVGIKEYSGWRED